MAKKVAFKLKKWLGSITNFSRDGGVSKMVITNSNKQSGFIIPICITIISTGTTIANIAVKHDQ